MSGTTNKNQTTIFNFKTCILKPFHTIYVLLLTVMLSLIQATAQGENDDTKDSGCLNYVSIQGSSNINQFQFINYNPIIHSNTITAQKNRDYRNIQVPVQDFITTNHHMLSDFYEMIHASKYPFINIKIEPREMADFDEETGLTNFKTQISIAGKSRDYVVPCEVTSCEDARMVLKGNLEMELSDFNMEPPKKVFGTVRVNNKVFINFVFKFMAEKTKKSKTAVP